jgi:lipopolysaccharide/colanic/teichoic acid biosynthesis glycosyltransferase
MCTNADKLVSDLKDINKYKTEYIEKPIQYHNDIKSSNMILLSDEGFVNALDIEYEKALNLQNTFFKVENDPRITCIGNFIRNTSIDELPQLFNVLIGDMSLVGNRPIPLYEAEKLTIDGYVGRFNGPSGITGLWQVNSRSNKNESEEERKAYDVTYANEYSPWMDFQILLKTLPAVLQKTNV